MDLFVAVFILIFLVFVVPVVVFGPILEKAGFSVFWALLLVIPIVNLIAIWLFSFVDWPAKTQK